MLIGYARISTDDQSLDLQIDALLKAGVSPENIYKETGSSVAHKRPELELAWKRLREGDTLVVWRLDRFVRSVRDLIDRFEEMKRMGVEFRSLTEQIDTTSPMGRFTFVVMGAMAQLEREIIVERTKAGLAAARARGKRMGREPKMAGELLERARGMRATGASYGKIAKALDVSRTTIVNHRDKIDPPVKE
jgi:DNA invertase Pin-like site-specific DNA recombinase